MSFRFSKFTPDYGPIDITFTVRIRYLWRDYHTPITKVDPTTRQLFTNVSSGITPKGVTNDSFYYAYGLHEELDAAGEWVPTYFPHFTILIN